MTTHVVQPSRYFETYTERPDPLGIPRSASKLKVVSKLPKPHDGLRKERLIIPSVSSKPTAPAGVPLLLSKSTELTLSANHGRSPISSGSSNSLHEHTQAFGLRSCSGTETACESPPGQISPAGIRPPHTLHRSSSSPSVSFKTSSASLYHVGRDVERLNGLPQSRDTGSHKAMRTPELKIQDSYTQTESIPTIEDIMRKHNYKASSTILEPVPAIPAKFKIQGDRILSIEEIIRNNKASLRPARQNVRAGSAPPDLQPDDRRKRTITADSENSHGRSSIDSITDEALHSFSVITPVKSRENGSTANTTLQTPNDWRQERQRSVSSTSSSKSRESSRVFADNYGTPAHTASEDITRYLRSARLTRLIRLCKPPNHHLTVSLADVGLDTGHPVLVCLGLGCVRYLVALYDELAAALGLRLICIDRWGLGRSDDVHEAQRSFAAWATVVEETLEQLGIERCSIIAHSAAAPYALAVSTLLGDRIHGSIHLLAPWIVNPTEASSANYKWLKYVPSGVLKAAHTAEWKVQGWKLGKSPTLRLGGLGFDPRAPISSDMVSPVLADVPTESSDEEGDGSLRSPSPTPTRQSGLTRISTSTRGTSTPMKTRQALLKSPSPLSSKGDKDLVTALLRASHSESLRGSTADLLCILNRSSTTNTIRYKEILQPIKVWHGSKDEKITLASVKVLESLVSRCDVKVVQGADHSLMTNVPVFTEALRSIASEVS